MRRVALYLSIACPIALLICLAGYYWLNQPTPQAPSPSKPRLLASQPDSQPVNQQTLPDSPEPTTDTRSLAQMVGVSDDPPTVAPFGSISGKVQTVQIYFQAPDDSTSISQNSPNPLASFEMVCVKRHLTPLPGKTVFLQEFRDRGDSSDPFEEPVGVTVAETVSDADGFYRFEKVASGKTYQVATALLPNAMRSSGDQDLEESPPFEVRGKPIENKDLLILLDGISIAGCIRDTEGSPIPSADVFLISYEFRPPTDPFDEFLGSEEPLKSEESESPKGDYFHKQSGADGSYRFDNVIQGNFIDAAQYIRKGRSEVHRVWARAQGYHPVEILVPPFSEESMTDGFAFNECYLRFHPEAPRDFRVPDTPFPKVEGNSITGIDLALPRSSVVSGRVVDTQGQVLVGGDPESKIQIAPVEIIIEPENEMLQSRPQKTPVTVLINESGEFRFPSLLAGTYSFKIHQPDDKTYYYQKARNAPLQLEQGQIVENLDVVIAAPTDRGTLSGRLFDLQSREPIPIPKDMPEINVMIERVVSPPENPTPSQGRFNLTLSSDNTFVIENISPGTATLRVRTNQYPINWFNTVIKANETTQQDFFLDRGGFVSGRVVDDKTDEGIEDYSVTILKSSLGHYRTMERLRSVEKGPQKGVFRLINIGTGPMFFEVEAKGYAKQRVQVELESGKTSNLTVRLKPEGIIFGRVTDEGKICNEAQVEITQILPSSSPATPNYLSIFYRTYTDPEDSSYQISQLAEGEYDVTATLDGIVSPKSSTALSDYFQTKRIRIASGEKVQLDFDFQGQDVIAGYFVFNPRKFDATVSIYAGVIPIETFASVREKKLDPPPILARAKVSHGADGYELRVPAPGVYTVHAVCSLLIDPTRVQEEIRTITVKAGEVATANFEF